MHRLGFVWKVLSLFSSKNSLIYAIVWFYHQHLQIAKRQHRWTYHTVQPLRAMPYNNMWPCFIYCAFHKHANSKFKSQLTIAFFTAVNHLNGPLRKQNFTLTGSKAHGLWFLIGGFGSVLWVSVFQDSHFIFKYCILAYWSGWGIFKKNWGNPEKVGMVVRRSIKVHMRIKPTHFPFEIPPT